MYRFRRVVAGVLTAASLSGTVGSCSADSERPQPVATTKAPADVGCPVPAVGPVDRGSVLIPGPVNGVPPSDARGEPLTIVATVIDVSCVAAAGATVRVWHTDATGEYGPSGTDRCCYYGGIVLTDANGRFRLDTIRPAQYPQPNAPPAHIHLEIRHASGRLDTEIIFTEGAAARSPVLPRQSIPVALTRAGTPPDQSWYGEVAFALSA
jgi:hypothetical protein